jgi:UDP-N-acetylmuramate dehydrogenase
MITIQEKIPLASYTTLQVGGVADYFAEPASESEVLEALRWARGRSLPLFVLGGGSNLLVSDAGFRGLILHVVIGGVESAEHRGRRIYRVGAGLGWDSFVERAVADRCAGIECLSGIPGSVGGTPIQNVGAYGQEVSESITRVRAIDVATLEAVEFDHAACGFHYRSSRFNRSDQGGEPGRYILTQVEYSLRPGGAPRIAYSDLRNYFSRPPHRATIPSLAQAREAVLEIRRAKGMVLDADDADSRSAGSFFQNPVVSRAEYERIAQESGTAVPHFDAGAGQVKLAAAWLIEQSGIAKGFALGAAAISRKHTLALVNRGGATAADILRLKEYVQQRVLDRFGVELHPEPVMLGFEARPQRIQREQAGG